MYDWIPDCSNEDSPPLPPGVHTLHRYSNDNDGIPTAHFYPPDTRIGAEDLGHLAPNSAAIYVGNTVFALFEDKPGDVFQPIPTGNLQHIPNYCRIRVREIDPGTGSAVSTQTLDAQEAECSLPKLFSIGGGLLWAVWKEHNSSGDRIMTSRYNGADWSAPISPSGTTYYTDIREYDACIDVAGDLSVVIRVHVSQYEDQVWTQGLTNGAPPAYLWNATGYLPMHQVGGYPLKSARLLYNPLIRWNDPMGRFEYAWGSQDRAGQFATDSTVTQLFPDSLTVQAIDLTPSEINAAGGIFANVTLIDFLTTSGSADDDCQHAEFYMVPCKGDPLWYTTDPAAEFLLYLDKNGNLKLAGFTIENPAVVSYATLHTATSGWTNEDDLVKPSGLVRYDVSAYRQDPIALYEGNSYTPDFDTYAYRLNADLGSSIWSTNYTGSSPADVNGELNQMQTCFSQGNLYALLPMWADLGGSTNKSILFRIDVSTGTFTKAARIDGHIPLDQIQFPHADHAYFEPSFSLAACDTSLSIIEFTSAKFVTGDYAAQYTGRGPFNGGAHRKLYIRNQETGEPQRVQVQTPYDQYCFQHYSTTTSTPYVADSFGAILQRPIIHHDPATAVFHSQEVTVYEEMSDAGNSKIMLGIRGTSTPYMIAKSVKGDTCYFQPRVAIIHNSSSGDFALITYVAEFGGGSAFGYSMFNLSSLSCVSGPTFYLSHTSHYYYRNWSVVFDSVDNEAICVFGRAYFTNSEIDAIAFDSTGSMLWYPGTLKTIQANYSDDYIDEVRAVFDPNDTNRGVFVTWRESPDLGLYDYSGSLQEIGDSAVIGLSHINFASGAVWTPGTILLGTSWFGHRGEPVVCAGRTWVYVAWVENWSWWTPYPVIFGCGVDSGGNLLSGSSWAGTQVSQVFTGQSSSTYQATQPDLVAYAASSMILAFECDDDPTYASHTNQRFIALENISPLSNTVNSEAKMLFSPTLSITPTDAENSLFGGYLQRHPKLTAFLDLDEGSKYFPALASMVMVAYEVEPYYLSNSYSPYTDIWSMEMARRVTHLNDLGLNDATTGQPVWAQNNIVARLIDPSLPTQVSGGQPLCFAQFSLARNTNAQDLVSLHYTKELGFTATFLDYVNTEDFNGVVKNVDINPFIMYSPGATSIPSTNTGGTWARGTAANTLNNIVYNTSWVPLKVYPDVRSDSMHSYPHHYWSVPNSITLPARSAEPIYIWYNANHGPCDLHLMVYGDLVSPGPYMVGPLQFCYYDTAQQMIDNSPGPGLKQSGGSKPVVQNAISLSLSANPSNGVTDLLLGGPTSIIVSIRVLNLLGAPVMELPPVQLSSNEMRVPLDFVKQPPGSYIVELSGSDGSRLSTILTIEK